MKKFVLIMLMTIIISIPVTANAAWYSNGYAWANSKGIIEKKTDAQLLTNVAPADFYAMLFKYFDLINVNIPASYFKMDDYKTDNYILVATDRQLTTYASKDWLTNDEYKKAVTLIENARNILDKNAKYFTESEKQSIEYYLTIMEYLMYTKIYDNDYKSQVYVAKPKNADLFIEYKLIPFYGEITREEFLNLVYKYTVADGATFSSGVTVGYYKYYDVLRGYDNNLMLTDRLNYAHFVTFISRM